MLHENRFPFDLIKLCKTSYCGYVSCHAPRALSTALFSILKFSKKYCVNVFYITIPSHDCHKSLTFPLVVTLFTDELFIKQW